MGTTVAELQSRMTAREFGEWMAYHQVEPFGAEADHVMVAQLTALTANVNRRPQDRPYMPEDFMPHPPEPVTPPTPEELREKVDGAMVGMGGRLPGGR